MRPSIQLFAAFCMAAVCAAVSYLGFVSARANSYGVFEYRRMASFYSVVNGVEYHLIDIDRLIYQSIHQRGGPGFAKAHNTVQNAIKALDYAASLALLPAQREFAAKTRQSLRVIAERLPVLEKALNELWTIHQKQALPAVMQFQKALQDAFDRPGKRSIPSSVWSDLAVLRAGIEGMAAFGGDAYTSKSLQALHAIEAALSDAGKSDTDKALQRSFSDLVEAVSGMRSRTRDALSFQSHYRSLLGEAMREAHARGNSDAAAMTDFGERLVREGESFQTRAFYIGTGCTVLATILATVVGVLAFRAAQQAPGSASLSDSAIRQGAEAYAADTASHDQ